MRLYLIVATLAASALSLQACKKSSPTPPNHHPTPVTHTSTFTPSATSTTTETETATQSVTSTATGTSTKTPTATSTLTSSLTPTPSATPTPTDTFTPIPTATMTSTASSTLTFTVTFTATESSTVTLTFTPTTTPTVTMTPCGSEAILGYNTDGAYNITDSGIRAVQVQVASTGIIRKMSFICSGASAGTVRFAVYSDMPAAYIPAPFMLLSESAPLTRSFTPGTWEVDLPHLPVTAGQTIWLAIMNHGATIDRDSTRTGWAVGYAFPDDGPFPSDLSAAPNNAWCPSVFARVCLIP